MEENVLREIEALDDAFGVSPKIAYKAVKEMVKRRKEERERFFSTISNGEAFRKAFEIYDI